MTARLFTWARGTEVQNQATRPDCILCSQTTRHYDYIPLPRPRPQLLLRQPRLRPVLRRYHRHYHELKYHQEEAALIPRLNHGP